MTREEYDKLRCLPENYNLTEEEFWKKYSDYKQMNYVENNKISDIDRFKENMRQIKDPMRKKVNIW